MEFWYKHLKPEQIKEVVQEILKDNERYKSEISHLQQVLASKNSRIDGLNWEVEDQRTELEHLRANRNKEILCPVCQGNFDTSNHIPFLLKCTHLVCHDCMDRNCLSGNSRKCPVCSTPFTAQDTRKVVLNIRPVHSSDFFSD